MNRNAECRVWSAEWAANGRARTPLRAVCRFALGLALCLTAGPLLAQTNAPGTNQALLPRPPRGELGPTFWEQYGLWVILAAVLLLALMGLVVYWLTRPKPPVVTPPAELARGELRPLQGQPEDGVLLSRVSQVLRHYMTAAFALPQEELTTTEFCRMLSAHEAVGPELAQSVGGFLRQCDERKFAPGSALNPLPAVPQTLKLIDLAEARRVQRNGATPAGSA